MLGLLVADVRGCHAWLLAVGFVVRTQQPGLPASTHNHLGLPSSSHSGRRTAAAALLVQFPGVLGLLALLAWAASDLLAAAWAALRTQPEVLQQLGGSRPALAASLQQALDAEASLDHATLALLRHALPAVPALLLGLLLGEGGQLVSKAGAASCVQPAAPSSGMWACC